MPLYNPPLVGVVPVKATGQEADTGTDDAKFLTAKSVNDSHNVPSVAPGADGNVLTSDGTDWVSETGGGGITNSAPSGTVPKTIDGSGNLGASQITETATGDDVTITTSRGAVTPDEVGVEIVGGTAGVGDNYGAYVEIIGGLGGDADGGYVEVIGGAGASGGVVTIAGGQALQGNNVGGEVEITGGSGIGSGNGGLVEIEGGLAGETGNGGSVTIASGEGGSTSGNGGNVTIEAGEGSDGGNVRIAAGTGTDTNGAITAQTLATFTAGDYDGDGNSTKLEINDSTQTISLAASILKINATVTSATETGVQEINKSAGSVNIAAAESSKQVNNSTVTPDSIILCTIATNDATAVIKNCVAGSGSFVITLNAAATAETRVNWWVITPQ